MVESNTPASPARRNVVAGLATAGFALAVSPVVEASLVQTDAEGLIVGERQFRTGDLDMLAYVARPAAGERLPVVLLVQEIFGLHEHIRDLARRLAKAGYLAIAPNLYQRQGDPTRIADISGLVRDIVAKVPDAQVMADLDAALAFAASMGGDTARVAVTGFCWGGRIIWLYAAHQPKLKAGVAWYGRLVGDANPLQPRHPVDVAAQLHAPVLGLYGESDTGIPMDTVKRMQDALAAAGGTSRIHVYAGAPHGFNADYRPSYVEADARDAWQRMLDWFRAKGV